MPHTKLKLAQALREANLPEMAVKAEEGYYHDFESPLASPALQLMEDIDDAIALGNEKAVSLRERHLNGDFDATKQESDDWTESDEGRAAFGKLTTGQ